MYVLLGTVHHMFPIGDNDNGFYCLTILAVNLLNKLWHFLFHKINIQSASQQMTSKTNLSCLRAQRILQSLAHLEVASHPLEIFIWTQHKCTISRKTTINKGTSPYILFKQDNVHSEKNKIIKHGNKRHGFGSIHLL